MEASPWEASWGQVSLAGMTDRAILSPILVILVILGLVPRIQGSARGSPNAVVTDYGATPISYSTRRCLPRSSPEQP